jgi:hypothetical protein
MAAAVEPRPSISGAIATTREEHSTMTRDDLRKLSDDQLRALSDDQFWGAIEPQGLCPRCDDPRLVSEAKRRNATPTPRETRAKWD